MVYVLAVLMMTFCLNASGMHPKRDNGSASNLGDTKKQRTVFLPEGIIVDFDKKGKPVEVRGFFNVVYVLWQKEWVKQLQYKAPSAATQDEVRVITGYIKEAKAQSADSLRTSSDMAISRSSLDQ